MKISVLIPIYKEIPNKFELISFIQCLKILNKHRFSLVIPFGLNIAFYEFHLKQFNISYSLEQFKQSYFQSINGYNKLMLSIEFYDRFINEDYILIYQLDSFVFKDELDNWCSLGYDYIGAPWLYIKNGIPVYTGVGNGGLSLRNPKKLKIYLESDTIKLNLTGYWELYSNYSFTKKIIRIPKILFSLIGYKNNKTYFTKNIGLNEDYVFGFVSQYCKNKLKVPSGKLAMQFAFDEYPRILYLKQNNKLPFGCHGWYRLAENIEFWKQFIKIQL